jgi:hypothetical protein
MPIEILPEGQPDWVEYSTTDGVLFLGLDPFWKTKTGKTQPNYAIMFRGGQGFFDKSINGGRDWTSILPSTQPSWFGDDSWDGYYYAERPYGTPSTESPPVASQLKYVAYSPNHVNSGEHYVLCTWMLADGGGISPSTHDVYITWLLYTTDDWVTHKWSMVRPYVLRALSDITNGTPTTLTYSDADDPEVYGTRLSNTKAALWTTGSGVPEGVYIITESSGTITEEDYTAGAVDEIMFNWQGDYLYFGSIYQDREVGGIKYFRARVYEWDVTGTTPSLTTYNSGDLPGHGSQSELANIGEGAAWHLTDSGFLCFKYWIRDGTGGASENVHHYLFYFDVNGNTWSTPYLYYDGLGNTVPRALDLCAVTVDDSNKMVVIEIDEWTWTGRGTTDWKCHEFMMVAGTWTRLDEDNFFNYLGTSYDYRITPAAACELSNSRVAFWITRWFISGATGGSRPRVYTYNTVLNTIAYDQPDSGPWPYTSLMDGDAASSIDEWDGLHVIGYNKMDNPSPAGLVYIRNIGNRIGSAADRLYYFDPDGTYPFDNYVVYSSTTEYDVVCLLTAYNQDGSATMIHAPWVLNGSYTIDVDVATVAERGPDEVFGKLPSGGASGHALSCSLDGTLIYIATTEWNAADDDTDLFCRLEYMTRQPDGQSGFVDFPANKDGHQWVSYADGFTLTNHNANAQYISLYPWEKETDGCLVLGLLYGVEFPSQPGQLHGVYPSGTWEYKDASGYTDPYRAVFYYNNKIYAMVTGSTALELWEEKSSIAGSGDDMQKVSNSSLTDSSVGIIADVDTRDGTIVVAGFAADPIVVGSLPPYSSWSDITLSHRIDKDVTGVVILL